MECDPFRLTSAAVDVSATLVVLEIVLGIDNLVFIAILADKLPPAPASD